jgi:hypothetical protein
MAASSTCLSATSPAKSSASAMIPSQEKIVHRLDVFAEEAHGIYPSKQSSLLIVR